MAILANYQIWSMDWCDSKKLLGLISLRDPQTFMGFSFRNPIGFSWWRWGVKRNTLVTIAGVVK